MTLIQIIKHKLKNISQKKLIQSMGYKSIDTGRKTLQSLLDVDDIYEWIKTGSFDFRYTSKAFVAKLCKVLEVDEIDYHVILDKYEYRASLINAEPDSYIFINTNFKRSSQPIFVLAIKEHIRRIRLKKELLLDMSKEEVVLYVSALVKEHFKESKGELDLWGKIDNYVLHYKKKEEIFFNKEGQVTPKQTVNESSAQLKIKNNVIIGDSLC